MPAKRSHVEKWLPILAITAVWASMHSLLLVLGGSIDGDLLGTDPYMRLVRVTELIDGGGWFDIVIERSNAPFGDELHWTRPLDVLLILMAAPLAPFIGFRDALLTAGIVVSPLMHLATLFVVVWAATPLLGAQRARFSGIVLVVQPMVLLQVMPGQADHHSLQLLALALELGLLLRLFDHERLSVSRRTAVTAGAVAGFGIWVSPEMTIVAGLAVTVLGLAWLRGAIPARLLRHYALGLTSLVAVALLVERLPADWLATEYDKVSLPHLTAGLAVLLVALAFEWIERRTTADRARLLRAIPVATVATAALLVAFRGLIEGPSAEVDPRLIPIWLDHVSELEPLLPTDLPSFGWLLIALGPALIALPYVLAVSWRTRHDPTSLAWATLALFFLAYFVLALWHVRFAPFAGIPLAIVSAQILGRMRDWATLIRLPILRRITWAITAPLFIVGFMLIGSLVVATSSDAEGAADTATECDLRAAAAAINSQPNSADAVVFAHIDFGPELLYRTDSAIVAGPYHRNGRGILDVYDFFSSSDLDRSRQLAEERGTRFALVCDTPNEAGFFSAGTPGQSLYERLIDDDAPEWLSLTAYGTADQRFRLYEFRSDR
ncbi:MAG: hypothetical protein HOH95_06225 [Dehalococcoidia bacterium]|nr:hypothetical protein [Dehalococcoidia bacterium]